MPTVTEYECGSCKRREQATEHERMSGWQSPGRWYNVSLHRTGQFYTLPGGEQVAATWPGHYDIYCSLSCLMTGIYRGAAAMTTPTRYLNATALRP